MRSHCSLDRNEEFLGNTQKKETLTAGGSEKGVMCNISYFREQTIQGN